MSNRVMSRLQCLFPFHTVSCDFSLLVIHGCWAATALWVGWFTCKVGYATDNVKTLWFQTVGQLFYLPKGVYALDNDRQPVKPRIAVASACKVYILKMEKRQWASCLLLLLYTWETAATGVCCSTLTFCMPVVFLHHVPAACLIDHHVYCVRSTGEVALSFVPFTFKLQTFFCFS